MKEYDVQLPPVWCSKICTNSLTDVCMEQCAIERDCSWFEIRPEVTLTDLPVFPVEEVHQMTKEEKFTSVVVYLAKVTQHLKGDENGKDLYRSRARRIPEHFKSQAVPDDPEQ